MLAKGPTVEAELARLVNEASKEPRAAIEAAVREAFEFGWRAHATAVAALDSPPFHANDVEEKSEPAAPEAPPSSLPSPDSQQSMVLDIVRRRPNGATSIQVIEAVQIIDRHMSAAAVRTNLHRLKIKTLITAQGGKWFPLPMSDGDTDAAASVRIIHHNQRSS